MIEVCAALGSSQPAACNCLPYSWSDAQGCSVTATVLGTPLLFGVAHLHHLREHVVHQGCALRPALVMVCLVAEPQLYSLWCRKAPPTST